MDKQKIDELINMICEILDTHLSSDITIQDDTFIMNEV